MLSLLISLVLFCALRLSSHSLIIQRWNQYSSLLSFRSHQDHRAGVNPLHFTNTENLLGTHYSAMRVEPFLPVENILTVPKAPVVFNIILI